VSAWRSAACAGALLASALTAALACDAARDTGEPMRPGAPPSVQATVVIEPPQLRVGDVADIEIAVVTPPNHAVRPLELPDASLLAPVWVLDAEALPVDKQPLRWTHRTRVRVRARDVGAGEWPALELELVGPEDEGSTLRTPPRPFDVVSVLPAFPDRLEPFPMRRPGAHPGISPWLAAAGGAAAALAAVGALALVRRRRRRGSEGPSVELAADGAAPWVTARHELAAAADACATDWRGAADAIAATLRRYTARRWGFAIECRTTEELAVLAPPYPASLRWPPALGWLRELDALRFRPGGPTDAPARVRQIAEAAGRWIEATTPAEAAE
jgi:hypothetical protein